MFWSTPRIALVALALGALLGASFLQAGWNLPATNDAGTTVPHGDTLRGSTMPSVAPSRESQATTPSELVVASSAPISSNSSSRAVVPLLLTGSKFAGVSLLATTLRTWLKYFLVPQGNIDLIIFYDVASISEETLVDTLHLSPVRDVAGDRVDPAVKSYRSKWDNRTLIRMKALHLELPEYVKRNPSVLDDASWLRCGCPPVCPERRATVSYVQGTRWYTYDMFKEVVLRSYQYWIKLDVDIWFFHFIPFNIVHQMDLRKMVFAHTGITYNGRGCSAELTPAILSYCNSRGVPIVSENESWWRGADDQVYYSNFVVSSVAFHLSPAHLALAGALNEYPTGFFKHRWTDQSLFRKVFGVFLGPSESSFALDLSKLRWNKRWKKPSAVFYHGKGFKSCRILRRVNPNLPCSLQFSNRSQL